MKIPAPEPKRTKTETLSLRLDPKTRFMLDIISRVKGQSITVIVERAIQNAADLTFIVDEEDHNGNTIKQKNWKSYWSPSEGVRAIKLMYEDEYRKTFEEEEILYFCKYHWAFFFTDQKQQIIREEYVEILWPKIEYYVEIWKQKKKSDNWIAGTEMKADLNAAKIKAPEWPPTAPKVAAPTAVAKGGYGDLDDEIPF